MSEQTPTEETEQWIKEHGSERDALNVVEEVDE